MRKPLKAFLIIAGVAIVCAAVWLWFSRFWHEPSRYTVVVRNDVTNTPLRSVGVRLQSDTLCEKYVYPVVQPGVEQERWYPLPGWSVPTRISVEFADPAGWGHGVSTTGAPPDFRGEICIVITKPRDYAAHLELKPQR